MNSCKLESAPSNVSCKLSEAHQFNCRPLAIFYLFSIDPGMVSFYTELLHGNSSCPFDHLKDLFILIVLTLINVNKRRLKIGQMKVLVEIFHFKTKNKLENCFFLKS